MELVQCRAVLSSLQEFGSTSGAGEDALDVWRRLTDSVKSSGDIDEDRAMAASLLFDEQTGIFRFLRTSISFQGARTRDARTHAIASAWRDAVLSADSLRKAVRILGDML